MDRRPIQFDCHYCLNSVAAWQDQCGQEISCPHCKTRLIVPSQPIDANLIDDIFDSLNPPASPGVIEPAAVDLSGDNGMHQAGVARLLDEIEATRSADVDPPESEPPKPLSLEASEPATSAQARTEDLPNAPSPTESADQPLKVEGLEFDKQADVITFKCKICDSRIHESASKIDSEVVCPVCFTKILVTPQLIDKRTTQPNSSNARETRLSYSEGARPAEAGEEAELQLLPTEAGALSPEGPVESSTRPAAVSGSNRSTAAVTVSSAGDAAANGNSNQPPPSGKPLSRRERYEAAQRRLAGLDAPPRRAVKARPAITEPSQTDSEPAETPTAVAAANNLLDEARMEYSLERLKEMLGSPGLLWRAVLVGIVIGVGSALMHQFNEPVRGETEPTIIESILGMLAWAGMGLLPYLLGVGLLWLLCGFVFREAANGNRQVSNWTVSGYSELQSTFLLVGFSFFVAGLPLAPISMLYAFVNPLRFLLAPLFLVAVWYNQNGLAIIGVDAFRNFTREMNQWGQFYSRAIGLAMLSFVAGLLLMISGAVVSYVASLAGALIMTFSTILFSAVAGWHCGWVVQGVKDRE